jgi:hypothetical protein
VILKPELRNCGHAPLARVEKANVVEKADAFVVARAARNTLAVKLPPLLKAKRKPRKPRYFHSDWQSVEV